MKINFTARTFLFVGFAISFTALILNAIILANVSNKLNAADAEYDAINGALRVQTELGNEAERKFEDYTMMTHIAAIVPEARREEAKSDASVLLDEAILFLYAAANILSMTEVRRAESEVDAESVNDEKYEEVKNDPKIAEKQKQEAEKQEKAKTPEEQKAETEKLLKDAVNILEKREPNPAEIDIKPKLSAISLIAEKAVTAENPQEFFILFYPVNKALNNKWLESVTAKQNRLAELENERRRLGKYQSYCTFTALALQMFGLAFVFFKDFSGLDRNEEENADDEAE